MHQVPPSCPSRSPALQPPTARAAALLLLAAPAPATARAEGDLDLVPLGIHASQAIQTGATKLSAGRACFVRVPVRAFGTIPKGALYDGRLRVYDGGVEIEGSPFYSQNGPLEPSATVNPSVLDATLNFVFLPPESSDVVVEVEVNPQGSTQIDEIDFSNNVFATDPLAFLCRANAEITFVPIDYRPFGGTEPNLPDPELIKPGVGDNFVQGIYPAGDWEYHRSDAPSKLWTGLLSDSFGGLELAAALAADMLLMNPVPDFIYGWVPGALPGYNGVSLSIPGVAAIGNTEPIRFQRTFAHELGHLFGLQHNTQTTNAIGLDVEHHLNLTLGLPQLQPATQKDIMYAGLLTSEAWVWEGSYDFFHDNQALACGAPAPLAAAPAPRLLLAGVHDRAAPALRLVTTLSVASAEATPFVPAARADLLLRVSAGGAPPLELGLMTRGSADLCLDGPVPGAADAEARLAAGGFAVLLPPGLEPDRVAFVDARSGALLHELVRSAHAPEGRLAALAPAADGKLAAAWEASDADGDALRSTLIYSPDGVRRVPLASSIAATQAEVDAAQLPALAAGGYFEVLVSDGLRTTVLTHQPSAAGAVAQGSAGSPPWVHVLTPDPGKSYPLGATVVLHSSGWDLEDRALGGASITWSSDLDGPIGVGRLASTADLSAGTHTLTVQATDSDGLSSTDATTITIADRELPGLICQPDLGFGGPGASVLSVCGGDLSTGTTASVELSGAAPLAPFFLFAAARSNPTSLFGGTVLPLPPLIVLPDVTDGAGAWQLADAVVGGGAFPLFLQAGYLDAAHPEGVGISNAVRVDYLP